MTTRSRRRPASRPSRQSGASPRDQVLARRRYALIALAAGVLVTLVLAVVTGSMLMLIVTLVFDVMLALYVAILLQVKQRRHGGGHDAGPDPDDVGEVRVVGS